MRTARLIQNPVISETQVREFIAVKRTFDLLNQEIKAVEEAYRTLESNLIGLMDRGYAVEGQFDLAVVKTERRNVGWKQVASEHLGAEKVAEILAMWPVTVTRKLQVR